MRIYEAAHKAEQLEQEAHDAIAEYRLEEAIGRLREALAVREAYQGEAHPDLFWTCHSGSTRSVGNTDLKAHWRRPLGRLALRRTALRTRRTISWKNNSAPWENSQMGGSRSLTTVPRHVAAMGTVQPCGRSMA
jgi:hypothetical protein